MSQPHGPRDLINAIHTSAGMQHINRSHLRSFSFNIFEINARELIEVVQQVHDPDEGLRLMSEANREASNQTHREVTRRIHNFAVSALTLVEHTRIFMREHYADTHILTRYEEKAKSEFASDPLSQFVQKLRNYMVHKGLPNSEMFLEINQNPASGRGAMLQTGVRLKADSLLEWDGWGDVARKYIESSLPYLDIVSLASNYLAHVDDFHRWLQSECDEYHRADLDELRSLQVELQTHYPDPGQSSVPNSEETTKRQYDEVSAAIESMSAVLHQTIRKLDLAFSEHKEFASERPVSSAITEEDMVGTPRLWTEDVNGQHVFAFIMTDDGAYGLDEESYQLIQPLTEKVLELPWAKDTLSRAFIEERMIEWLEVSYGRDAHEQLESHLEKAASDSVRPLALWAPVANLEIAAPFAFGPVEFRPMTKAMFDKREAKITATEPQGADEIRHLFDRLRNTMQGYAAVVIEMRGDPRRLEEEGGETAKAAVSLLRFISPAATNPTITSSVALLGSERISAHHWMVIGEETFTYSEGMDISAAPGMRIPDKALTALKPNFDALGALVRPENLTPFAFNVRASLLLFSTGLTLSDPLDRLSYCVSAVEKLLLRHSAEAREFHVAERMRILIAQIDTEESADVPPTTRETYRLLTRREFAPLAPHQLLAAHVFMRNAHHVLRLALINLSWIETPQQFVDSIDHIARQKRCCS